MKNFYKCLTAVLVTLVTCFSASAFTVVVDHPEAVTVKLCSEYGDVLEVFDVVAGTNSFSNDEAGNILFQNNAPWNISVTGPQIRENKYGLLKGYVAPITANSSAEFIVTSNNPEVSEPNPTYITLETNNTDALLVSVQYTGEVAQSVEPQNGVFKIETTKSGGTLSVKPADSWKITSWVGLRPNEDGSEYSVNFSTFQTASYNIDVEKIVTETKYYVTINIDNPEAVEVQFSSDWGAFWGDVIALSETTTMLEIGDYSAMRVKAVSPWIIESCPELNQFGEYYQIYFGEEDLTCNITTKKETVEPSYATLTIDNPQAVTIQIEFQDEDGNEIDIVIPEFVNGEYKIDTTHGGLIYMSPNAGWTVKSAEGFINNPDSGMYFLPFEAGATDVYTITTEEDTTTPFITLTVDNPERVTVEVMEDMRMTPIQPDADGVCKINTTKDVTVYVTPVEPWLIFPLDEWTKNGQTGGYYIDVKAGTTEKVYQVFTHKPTYFTLNIEYPDAVFAKVTYDGGETYEDLTLKKGENKFEILNWGSVKLIPNTPWEIDSCNVVDAYEQPIPDADGAYTVWIGTDKDYYCTVTSHTPTSVESIFGDEVIETAIFNLQGIKVADTTENLPAGVYIVAGKKVLVK